MKDSYSNNFASVEKTVDGWECFNDVTGLFVKLVKTWQEARAFLIETSQYYQAIS